MPRKKTKKTKLSPAEKKGRKREAGCMVSLPRKLHLKFQWWSPEGKPDMAEILLAKKREDPGVCDKENAQQRALQAKQRQDPDVREKRNIISEPGKPRTVNISTSLLHTLSFDLTPDSFLRALLPAER
ncbi:hypothetical protein THAOC_21277 [Thalassiosira oceanica]|uniref:Uncharacterized protein n=1 Tax=Thalassiosira oceanica TaxID=159749 RepID=K0S1F2_THAOC|nr:hypothetical protein THAOC_21277 [Thalassiosira oceanica]|eukprot:EJK58589.1 hypothetical protein THAOC_21277 [Thalassiosira oceanica]